MAQPEKPVKDLEVLWKIREVAKYLGVDPNTVYRWLSGGTMIDPSKVVRFSNRIRIPRSEVERLAGIARKKIATQSQ